MLIILYFPGICASGIEDCKTSNQAGLGVPARAKKASELSVSAEALILGLVLECDLLTLVWSGVGELNFSRD